MKIKKEKAWINVKCSECGKLIYPDIVVKVKPEKGKVTNLAEWSFDEECFDRLFSNEVKKK